MENGTLSSGDAELAIKDLERMEKAGKVTKDQAHELKVKLMGV